MNIKRSIKIALAQADKTQSDLAQGIGMSKAGLSIAMTRNSLPSQRLVEIAEFFGMESSEFIKLGES